MKGQFKAYDGDMIVNYDIDEEKQKKIVERILQYCMKNDCFDGETLHQDDDCIIDAPSVLSDIIDKVIVFDQGWVD